MQAWGAGGGGGGGTGTGAGGGGGGGGYSTQSSIAVTPSTTYTVTVGTGGSGGAAASNGTAGGNSWFNTTGTIIANGGARGSAGPLGAGGAGGSGSQFSGGTGGIGIVTFGGGGGGGAGTSGAGGSAIGATAGAAGSGGGAGASGSTGAGSTDNTAPGGGGAGGGGTNAGSAGRDGRVIITHAAIPLTVSGVTVSNKTYDGTTSSTINVSGAALVGVVAGDTVTLVTSGASGVFSSASVGTGKTVTISGLSISGADSGNYTLTQPTTTANIIAATTSVAITESGGSTAITEGGATDSYTIMLQSLPSSTVTIVLTSTSTRFTLSTTTISFTTSNWNTPQTITLTSVNDSTAMGNVTASITHSASSGDLGYNGITIASVSVSVTDDDSAGVQVSATTLSINEGATSSYTIVLHSEPTDFVTIGVSVTSSDLSLSTSSITFSTSTWNTPRTVVVTAVEDADNISETGLVISHSVSSDDSTYSVLSVSSTVVSIADNDTGVTISESGGTTSVTEGGSTDSYTIVLNTAPSTSVFVTITSASSDISVSTTTLTFTTSNWNTPQTVTVSAVDDSIYEGTETATITHSASSSDTGYEGITIASVTVTITDNDAAPVSSSTSTTSQRSGTISPSMLQIPVTVTPAIKEKQLLPTFASGNVVSPQVGVQSINRISVLSFSGVEQAVNMALSLTGDFTNAVQQPFNEQVSWDVCQGETACRPGLYKMHVRFFGSDGAVSDTYTQPVWYWGNAARINGVLAKNSGETKEVYLYKQETRPEVYAVVDKVKHWIPSEKEFNNLRLSWADIQVANDDMINALSIGRFVELKEKISTQKSALPVPETVVGTRFTSTLSQGDNSDVVLFLQTLLLRLGFFPQDVAPNGNFGPVTQKAVTSFQTKNGLEQVGVVGPKTRALLNKFIETP